MSDFLQGTYIPKKEEDIDMLLSKYLRDITKSDGSIYQRQSTSYERVSVPKFKSKSDERIWWKEQVRRCKQGYDGMAPVMYFYYNFCKILTPQGKKISPQFYRTQNDFFWWCEDRLRGNKIGQGIILLKRRRWGFSWAAEALLLHEAIFYKYSHIGQQSKGDEDVVKLFDKLKFIYNELPEALKPHYLNFNRNKIFFARKIGEGSQKRIVGNQSVIECKNSTDTAWEGSGMKVWYSDESGKISNIGRIWRMTEPALAGADGFNREGLAIIGGTAGDVDKDAWEFVELWTNAEAHKLDRFFVPGWANMHTDKYGNEDVPKSVREILENRLLRVNNQKDLYTYMQQYPLSPEEALLGGESPCFDIKAINSQMTQLAEDPPATQRGFFQWVIEGETVRFVPDIDGAVEIVEHPKDDVDYIGGCDPVDHSGGAGSHQAMFIQKVTKEVTDVQKKKMAKEMKERASTAELMSAYLKMGNIPVMMMYDNPANPQHFWEQALMACIYYSKTTLCKVHVESNRPGMIGWMTNEGYREYLHKRSSRLTKQYDTRMSDYGEHMTKEGKEYRTSLVDSYIRNGVRRIFFYELLKHMKGYNPDQQRKKYDTVDAFGMCLIKLRDKKLRFTKAEGNTVPMVKRRYVRENGKLVLKTS